MTTITATPLAGDSNTALFNFLKTKNVESFEPFVYTDSRNLPTLGVGYALVTGYPGHWHIRPNYQAEFAASGINYLTATQLNVLQTSLQDATDSLNGIAGTVNPFKDTTNVLDWDITEPQALALFNTIIPQYEATAKTWLGSNNVAIYNSLLGSREMLVLISLAYNGFLGVGKCPNLHDAIISGNRAEAWYEIRFNTPTSNITRNYAQGTIFGLYEPGNITKDEALSVYKMYTKHHDTIVAYDINHASLIVPANGVLSTAGILGTTQKLELELRRAADTIETEYLQPNNLTLGSINPLNIQISYDGTPNLTGEDTTTRTGYKDDLLLGDVNENTLQGKSGNDILLGGDGNDTLFGNEGDDVLIGGDGKDLLEGGQNFDTYIANNNDTIIDSDGQGKVIFEGLELHGGTNDSDNDGHTYIRLGSKLFVINRDKSALITINHFKDDDLGIHFNSSGNTPGVALGNIPPLFVLAQQVKSPVVLDLNGDGIVTNNLMAGVHFDHNSNGFAEQTGWVNNQDGLLVRDLNGNGKIDNGTELFGSETLLPNGQKAANGYLALAVLDENGDNQINAQDSAFMALKIWKDANGDGISSATELFSTADLGIQSIAIHYTTTDQTDANGNSIKQTSAFTKTDGSGGNSADIWFQVNNTYTVATDILPETAAVAALPDLSGFGNVYNLHQAMLRDNSGHLQDLVQQFINAADPAARHSLRDDAFLKIPFLARW